MPQEFTDDETDVEQWEREARALDDDRRIFEPWCGDCMRALSADEQIPGEHIVHFGVEPGVCDCKEPCHIFVGKSTAAPVAWDAAGVLLELVQRAAIIIKRQGDELDQYAAREVRDEELMGQLRSKIDDMKGQIELLQKDLKAEIAWGQKHAR